MSIGKINPFSLIPKVDDLLIAPEILALEAPYRVVVETIREVLELERERIKSCSEDQRSDLNISKEEMIVHILALVNHKMAYKLKRVINATGVVIHTNLGRSLLHPSVMPQLQEIACGYSNLEFKIKEGTRGSRYDHVESLLCQLTGAEAALVVNNNAAAVLLTLSTLGKGKEVIVSRGQLVEIGGAFRVPDVMKQSGCELIEVGTTNKTHLRDYKEVVTPQTGVILKVHTSNYRILGFTQEVASEELSQLAREQGVPFVEDIGSGSLVDLTPYGLTKEPTVKESLDAGVDVVTFSGDKMLGGPQAGIIVGKREYIERMKKNPLTRALRVDKMTFAALEGTLRLYLDEAHVIEQIPTLRMLTLSYDKIKERASALMQCIQTEVPELNCKLVDGDSEVGGGSLPLEKLSTALIAVTHPNISVARLANQMRLADMPVIVRISEEQVLLDCRTLQDKEEQWVISALKWAVTQEKAQEA